MMTSSASPEALTAWPGDTVRASVWLNHRGDAESVLVSWGLAKGQTFGHDESGLQYIVRRQPFDVDFSFPTVTSIVFFLQGVLPEGVKAWDEVDCYILIEKEGTLKKRVDGWFDKVFAGAKRDFQNLHLRLN